MNQPNDEKLTLELMADAERGLREVLAGQVVPDAQLDALLTTPPSAWAGDNLAALESSNAFVAKHGLPLANQQPERTRMTDPTQSSQFKHLLGKCRDAKLGGEDSWGAMSTGEQAGVCLTLNRADWLEKMGYTMVEAIDRVGPEWVALMPLVVRTLRDEE